MEKILSLPVVKKDISVTSADWSCRDKFERLYPECEWKESFLFAQAISSEHPFLQKLIDFKGLLTNVMGEWTYFGHESMAMIHIYKDFVNLECISTPDELRGKGSAGKLMAAIIQAAKETSTELRLRACNVTGNGWNLPQHPVVAHGIKKRGKIPTSQLPKWYAKFGFVQVGIAMHRGKKAGVNMVYNADTKLSSGMTM